MGLIGQNGAGKSTLMNILGGVVRADSGEMILTAAATTPHKPSDATGAGIAFIHQELNLFTNLSIAETSLWNCSPGWANCHLSIGLLLPSAPKKCWDPLGLTSHRTC